MKHCWTESASLAEIGICAIGNKIIVDLTGKLECEIMARRECIIVRVCCDIPSRGNHWPSTQLGAEVRSYCVVVTDGKRRVMPMQKLKVMIAKGYAPCVACELTWAAQIEREVDAKLAASLRLCNQQIRCYTN